jgi:hypothetical protein
MVLVLSRLKRFNLGKYGCKDPIIFIEANDPDGACHDVVYQLYDIMNAQNPSAETKELFKDILQDIRIIKVSTT